MSACSRPDRRPRPRGSSTPGSGAAPLATKATAPGSRLTCEPSSGSRLTGAMATDRRGEAFAAWRSLLEAFADQRPLVLVFEDLHWADGGLLDFIDQLVDRLTEVPLLVVATARPELLERRPAWGGGSSTPRPRPVAADRRRRPGSSSTCCERAALPPETRRSCLSEQAATRSTRSSSASSIGSAVRPSRCRCPRRCKASSRLELTACQARRRPSSRTRRWWGRSSGAAPWTRRQRTFCHPLGPGAEGVPDTAATVLGGGGGRVGLRPHPVA